MEDYKKKYDELLLKLQKAKVDDNVCDEMYCCVIDDIVPELKESEDEMVRKDIIKLVEESTALRDYYDLRKMTAWLEKQGEQKPQGNSALEATNEEKVDNVNKVRHKFNEGDWVVNRENKIGQIKALKKDKYNVLRYCIEWRDDKKTNSIQYYTDNYCYLWTLSDVKNGDILNSPSHHLIWIYKDNETAHICVNMNYVKDNVFTEGLIVIPEDACPANKLQRDILFSKIKEAGYEWDADKKELKKIEQKSVEWSEEDEKMLSDIIEFGAHDRLTPNDISWLNSLRNRVQPKPKQEWSEGDENLLKLSLENLTELKGMYGEEYCKVGDCISWLKSLKQRYTWKPSDKQMEVLKEVTNIVGHKYKSYLNSLYSELKKLK